MARDGENARLQTSPPWELAFTAEGKLLNCGEFRPMFGALKKGPRLRRKERKTKQRKAKK
jgi:hypothetical protein